MKNILQNFYLFSKLSLSISLLIILILLGYLFYKSYSLISVQETVEVTKNNDLLNSINLNASKIERIEFLLNENNAKLIDIMNSLDSPKVNNQSNLVLKEIQSDFNNIKLELKKIKNNLQKNEITEVQSSQVNSDNANKENTVQLIIFKFENGQDYYAELELLSTILGSENSHIIEKLYLINNDRFIGSKILKSNFKNETNNFISSNLLRINKMTKVILPYIKIEPSKKQKLSDYRLIAIDNIFRQIENKNYAKSIDLINAIDKDNKFFSLTIDQLSIAVDFKNTIEEIIK